MDHVWTIYGVCMEYLLRNEERKTNKQQSFGQGKFPIIVVNNSRKEENRNPNIAKRNTHKTRIRQQI